MAAPDPPSTLTYMPLGYRHRQSRAVGFAILTGIAAAVVAAIHWRGGGAPWWGQAMIVGVPGALTVLAYFLRCGAECRVEGEALWFASENTPPVSIAIEEIIARRFMRNPTCPACDMRLPKFGQFVP